MALGFGIVFMFVALAVSYACVIDRRNVQRARRLRDRQRGANRGVTVEVVIEPSRPPRKVSPPDPVAVLTAEWLADERPAWMTVADFDQAYGRAIGLKAPPRGDRTPF